MSASDFTLSMIFVFERSFAVGFCPSIQMYSAVIFAKGDDPPSRGMRKDSRSDGEIRGEVRLARRTDMPFVLRYARSIDRRATNGSHEGVFEVSGSDPKGCSFTGQRETRAAVPSHYQGRRDHVGARSTVVGGTRISEGYSDERLSRKEGSILIVLDSSGWLEYFGDGPYADEFAARMRNPANVL